MVIASVLVGNGRTIGGGYSGCCGVERAERHSQNHRESDGS